MRKALRILRILNVILIASVILLLGLNLILLTRYHQFSLVAFGMLDITCLIEIPINIVYNSLVKHKNKYHG